MVVNQDTLKKVAEEDSIYKAIEWGLHQSPEFPKSPIKPRMPSYKADSQEMTQYVTALKLYEEELEKHKPLIAQARRESQQIEEEICDYIKWESGLNSVVPSKYREKIMSIAWERGHSDGLYSVYNNLLTLVSIFE